MNTYSKSALKTALKNGFIIYIFEFFLFFLIHKKPKILGFFIIIIFGGGANGLYHTSWLDAPLPHLQNCHNCMHHFEILCMALFCKMGSQLLQQQLNGQRDMLELCIFYVSQSTYTNSCLFCPFQIVHHFWIDFFFLL